VPSAAGGAEIVFDHFSCCSLGLIYMSLQLTEADGPPELSEPRRAERLSTACSQMYNTTSGLCGEKLVVRRDAQLERVGEYNLRPEVVEALLYESRLAPSASVRQARASARGRFLRRLSGTAMHRMVALLSQTRTSLLLMGESLHLCRWTGCRASSLRRHLSICI
jgi:hypothetical protein